MYWRYDEEVERVELDYPRDVQMWRGIPYHFDAVFQWHDKKTYFFKDKYFWEFDDGRMKVSRDSPRLIGEFWLQCPREMQDPLNTAETSSGLIVKTHLPLKVLLIMSLRLFQCL